MLRRTLDSALDFLLPRHCVLCLQASGARNLCAACWAELPWLEGEDRRWLRPGFTVFSALSYRSPVDFLVRQFKFRRRMACGEILAQCLVHSIGADGAALPDCLLPVPLHPTRLFGRTFNQASVLAHRLAREIKVPVADNCLLRNRITRAQSGLDARERRRNLKGAFRLRNVDKLRQFQSFALVDDVATSGETLRECTRALKSAGLQNIEAWTVAIADQGAAHQTTQ